MRIRADSCRWALPGFRVFDAGGTGERRLPLRFLESVFDTRRGQLAPEHPHADVPFSDTRRDACYGARSGDMA